MSTLLINANQPEEIRIALLEKKTEKVSDFYIESTLKKNALENIYAGIIKSIEPSLEAVFVEYGSERHGFLPFKKIAPYYFQDLQQQEKRPRLKIGQTIIVQIKKEARHAKGAALTTYITLAGSYLILMPNQPSAGGISKKILGEERKLLQQKLSQLNIPKDMGIIVRTASQDCTVEHLKMDLEGLINQWNTIQEVFSKRKAPFLIFKEGDILMRAIRDYARTDIQKIIVDSKEAFEKVKAYTEKIRPDLMDKLTLYQDKKPLFHKIEIEKEIESAFQQTLRLPSGGNIVINLTTAAVTIDVNSAGSTESLNIAETALKTNLEAAVAIAQQLRLRDLGGIVVIDFIDMEEESHQQKVDQVLREAFKDDRARVQIGSFWEFGLKNMTRQRLRPSLGQTNEELCIACQGQGTTRSTISLALSAIRAIEAILFSKRVQQVCLEASLALITYISNEKRQWIYQLEKNHQCTIVLLPNPHWSTSRYEITQLEKEYAVETKSYNLLQETIHEPIVSKNREFEEIPAVANFEKRKEQDRQPSGFFKKTLRNIVSWGKKKLTQPHQSSKAISSNYQNVHNENCSVKKMHQTIPGLNKPVSNTSVLSNKRQKINVFSYQAPFETAQKVYKNTVHAVNTTQLSSNCSSKKDINTAVKLKKSFNQIPRDYLIRITQTQAARLKQSVLLHRSFSHYGGEIRIRSRSYMRFSQ